MCNDTNDKAISRREIREQCFSILFEMTFTDESVQDIVDNAVESRMIAADAFTSRLLESFESNSEEIDGIISEHIKGWTLSRLSRVTLSILRLCITEMKYLGTPEKIAINEAVELAKKYSTPKETAFVNGVLGSAAKTMKIENNAEE